MYRNAIQLNTVTKKRTNEEGLMNHRRRKKGGKKGKRKKFFKGGGTRSPKQPFSFLGQPAINSPRHARQLASSGFQARSKDQEILEEGGGAGPSTLSRRDHE